METHQVSASADICGGATVAQGERVLLRVMKDKVIAAKKPCDRGVQRASKLERSR
jgi:hypothetical protein